MGDIHGGAHLWGSGILIKREVIASLFCVLYHDGVQSFMKGEHMSNDNIDFISLLNLADDSAIVSDITYEDSSVIVHIQKNFSAAFCPVCHSRMLSKGPRTRNVNHPILQDGRKLILRITSRKWFCPVCRTYSYDQFSFVEKSHQHSSLTHLMILDRMKDLSRTATSIALDLNVSDTFVHQTFMRYVDLPRLPLPEVLSIDEVHMKFDEQNLYATILLDWKTGELIDILPNRFEKTLHNYFYAIDRSERDNVKYLVSDMYDTFTRLAGTTFRNAISVIDCFHHTQPLIKAIENYMFSVRKRYLDRDRKALKDQNYLTNRNRKTRKDSREVYLLKQYDWLLTKNKADISYEPYYRSIRGRGGSWFYLEPVEKEFMALDPLFPKIRDLKEKYIQFTHSHVNDVDAASVELDELIDLYRNSNIDIFRNFANTLTNHKKGILNSFIYLDTKRSGDNAAVKRRISNGLMEAYNNAPKDLKRSSHGVSNFEYTRNRLLWANRTNPSILAIPKSLEEIHTSGEPRGPYKKK